MPGILDRWRSLFRPSYIQFSFGPDAPAEVLNMTARTLYNTQDNLSAVVNFIANSIAQLPLKVYRRKDGNRRERDRTSKAALLLYYPNKDQTEYEFIRNMMVEYLIFGCVYIWVLEDAESESGYQARVIPTDWIVNTEKRTPYAPDRITVTANGGGQITIERNEFIRFCTVSPGNPGGYVSPVSALRQTLEEQIQAGRFRKDLWKSSGRLNAQIVRPKDVAPWEEGQRERWIAAFREAWGAGGSNAGKIPLMEDGMEIKPFQTSFKEQQWIESVKLSRESVAAAYGINPSLVWHSDTQTYASSKDNARALYAECLGPILQMFQQRINAFLLPMVGAEPGTYVEFDLSEKLKGSFEERAGIMQSSVGGPWLTRNEARSELNLPPIEGGDELIVPLNVITGGQASPTDTHMEAGGQALTKYGPDKCPCGGHGKKDGDPEKDTFSLAIPQAEKDKVTEILESFFARQKNSILPKISAGGKWWQGERWNKELADDLEPVLNDIAINHGSKMARAIGTEFVKELIVNYLRKMAEARANVINDQTRLKLESTIAELEDGEELSENLSETFEKRGSLDAPLLGAMLAKTVSGWGTEEACRQAEKQGSKKKVYKEWVTGASARNSHALMNGETVPIEETFSNGAYWPGDDNLDPDESCGCNCSTRIIIMEE